jgi:predicted ATPase
VTRRSGTNAEATSPEISPDVAQLPAERRIIGREVEVARTAALVAERPLVTLVGPGGVGKTSVAIVAAHRLLDIFPDKPCFIDFSLVQDCHHVPTLVASALGMRGSPLDASLAIAEFIGARRMLVIFDSCEHVLPGVQALTSRILERNTTSRLILTSREPLGVREETLVHVRSLPVPVVFRDRAADDLLCYPAVELFLTRAQEWTDFEFRSSMAGAVASICRSLDGLPLALEIGAAQLDCHEPAELLAKLTKHLADFGNKNDSAPSRQKTLWATLDWSYKLLSADEAVIFRFLSVFAGSFDLEDVLAVLGPLRLDAYRIAVGLGALVAKSLVVADADGTGLRYRLLDSARGYALERAGEDPRLISVQESYAHYLVDLFKKAEAEWLWRETTDWRSHYKSRLNDLRQVLDWCFGPGSQPHLGFELTVCVLPLWDELSSTAEAQSRIEQSLKHADKVDVSVSSLAKLTRAHAWHLLYADQVVSESTEAWETAIGYAQQTGEVEYELRALWGFGCFLCHNVNVEQAFGIFERFRDLSIRNKAWTAMPDGEWHHALVEIYLGRLVSARGRLEKLARDNPLVEPRTCAARFVVDRHIAIQTHYSFLLWLIGEPERALRLADEVSGLPDQIHNPVSRVGLLAWCRLPIAMWNGDWAALSGFASNFGRSWK